MYKTYTKLESACLFVKRCEERFLGQSMKEMPVLLEGWLLQALIYVPTDLLYHLCEALVCTVSK